MLTLIGLVATACSTPEQVVTQSIEAAAEGDVDRYVATFTTRSRPLLWLYLGVAEGRRPELTRLSSADAEIVEVEGLAPDAEGRTRARVTVREGGETARLVLHEEAGAWRIDLIDTERGTLGYGAGF